jgi:hypothetical protein
MGHVSFQMRGHTSPLDDDEAGRFRPLSDWFVTSRDAAVHVARIGTTAERAVDLMLGLTRHLDPAVDVVVTEAPAPVWVPSRSMLAPSPELASALAAAAARLGLRVPSPTSAQ